MNNGSGCGYEDIDGGNILIFLYSCAYSCPGFMPGHQSGVMVDLSYSHVAFDY